MNRRTAQAIANEIKGLDGMRVNGFIERDTGAWALTVTDTRTSIQFVVNTPEDWADRRDDASIDWGAV